MSRRCIDVDTTYFIGKNGIARDANRLIEEISSCYKIVDVELFGLNLKKNKLIRRLLNITNLLLGVHFRIASHYYGIFYQPHLSPLKPGKNSKAWVIRLHDIFPLTNPEWFRWWAVFIFKRNLDYAVKNGATFLFSSEYSKNRFTVFYPDCVSRSYLSACKPSSLLPTLCSDCDGCHEIVRNPIATDTLLAVGTIEPRKNYDFLISFWEEMHSNLNQIKRIVIVGNPGWKSKQIQKRINRSSRLNIIWLKNSCDGALNFFYQESRLFVSTSKDEGFNLPALEARALYGLPVFLSDIPIHREIHGELAFYFKNASELSDLIILHQNEPKANAKEPVEIHASLVSFFDEIGHKAT
jgi:glycosyltransferase involved in cell wall biosynthesis